MKLNFDGSSRPLDHFTSIGGIIHNEDGSIMVGFSGAIDCSSPLQAKLSVLLVGLQLCMNLKLNNGSLKATALSSYMPLKMMGTFLEIL